MNKKLKIFIAVIFFLSAAAAVFVAVLFHTIDYFSGTVEKSFNISLQELKEDMGKNTSLSYKPFQCSGQRSIICNGDNILIKYKKREFQVKDVLFTLTPYYDNADITLKGKAVYKTIVDNEKKTLPVNFECYGSYQLMAESKMIKTNYWCNTYINYLKTFQQASVYFQNNNFDKGTIYEFAKKFDDFILNNQFQKAVAPTKTALEKYTGYIESKDLFQEYLNIIRRFDPAFDYSKEEALMSLPSYKADLFFISIIFGKQSAQYAVYEKIMQSLKGVLEKDNNKITVNIKKKQNVPVKSLLFSAEDTKKSISSFIDNKYYTLDIKSSKTNIR